MLNFRLLAFLIVTVVITSQSFAQRGGGSARRGVSLSGEHSLSVGFGLITAEQNNMDDTIDSANASLVGTVKNLESGLEYFAQYSIRFDGSWWGIALRPSWMNQKTDGNCGAGKCKYELDGFSIFPMIRMIPLENELIKLFFQLGLGYGTMKGEISQPAGNVKFEGSAFGVMGGLGVDFCLSESHCITVEGNLRYLPIERNLVKSGSGTISGISGGSAPGEELERNSRDLSTTMSGLQGLVSYMVLF